MSLTNLTKLSEKYCKTFEKTFPLRSVWVIPGRYNGRVVGREVVHRLHDCPRMGGPSPAKPKLIRVNALSRHEPCITCSDAAYREHRQLVHFAEICTSFKNALKPEAPEYTLRLVALYQAFAKLTYKEAYSGVKSSFLDRSFMDVLDAGLSAEFSVEADASAFPTVWSIVQPWDVFDNYLETSSPERALEEAGKLFRARASHHSGFWVLQGLSTDRMPNGRVLDWTDTPLPELTNETTPVFIAFLKDGLRPVEALQTAACF